MMYPKQLIPDGGQDFWAAEQCIPPGAWAKAFLHKNYSMRMHTHDFCEVNVVISGSGCHYIEQMSLPVIPGDVFIIPSGIRHGYLSGDNLNVFHILVRDEYFRRYREELEGTPGFLLLMDIEPLIRQSSGGGHLLHLDGDALNETERTLEKIMQADSSLAYGYQNALLLNLLCSWSVMLNEKLRGAADSPETDPGRDVIRVMDYIQRHLDHKLTIDALARITNMSRATLGRRFRQVLNVTPMEYVRSCRISRARRLISEGTLNKTEIAQACGFYDSSHMEKYLH